MLGLVFTELIEMVEDRFSPEVADRMLEAVEDQGGGVYTAVGSYPHEQVGAMVARLAEITGVPADDLVRAFGRHLLTRFASSHPAPFVRHPDVFDFLASIDTDIHVQVRKLYAAATPPRFQVLERDARTLRLQYLSPRRMESLALGLMEQLGEHLGQPLHIEVEPGDGPTVFRIHKVAA